MKRIIIAFALFGLLTTAHAAGDVDNPQTNQSALVTNKGQLPGTAANDSASAGNVGEIIASYGIVGGSQTVTISNASPAVISDSGACAANQNGNCVGIGNVVNFTTTGGLPTGLTVGVNYYVLAVGFVPGTSYQVSLTPFGTPINTSGAGSGTQSRINSAILTSTNFLTLAAVQLTAGDWDCRQTSFISGTGAVTTTRAFVSTTNNSATGVISESTWFLNIAQAGPINVFPGGPFRISISGTTNYYLNGTATFSTGIGAGQGSLICRRMR